MSLIKVLYSGHVQNWYCMSAWPGAAGPPAVLGISGEFFSAVIIPSKYRSEMYVLYTNELKIHLSAIKEMGQNLAEHEQKSCEQFRAEIDFMIVYLREAQKMCDLPESILPILPEGVV